MEKKTKLSLKRNVVGINIIKNIEEKDFKESNGSHCNIKFCRYEL